MFDAYLKFFLVYGRFFWPDFADFAKKSLLLEKVPSNMSVLLCQMFSRLQDEYKIWNSSDLSCTVTEIRYEPTLLVWDWSSYTRDLKIEANDRRWTCSHRTGNSTHLGSFALIYWEMCGGCWLFLWDFKKKAIFFAHWFLPLHVSSSLTWFAFNLSGHKNSFSAVFQLGAALFEFSCLIFQSRWHITT